MSDSTEERAERARLVREWIKKAESDLGACRALLKNTAKEGFFDIVCFHAEQCVEKLIKAVLVWRGVDFEKNHHIPTLVLLMPEKDRPPLTPQEQRDLKSYAVDTRYTLDLTFTEKDALAAVGAAGRTRDYVLSRLKGEKELGL